MKRHSIRLIFILILFSVAVWVVLPSNPGINLPFYQRQIRVVQGLDLQGGLRVLLEADLPEGAEISTEKIQTARDIVENRVNGLGVSEPLVQIAGSRRILVELPGIDVPEEAIATIKETGLLEFIEMDVSDVLTVLPGDTVSTDFGGTIRPPELEETENTPFSTVTTEAIDNLTSSPSEAEETIEPISTPTSELPSTDDEAVTPPTEKIFHTVMTGAELDDAGVIRDNLGNLSVGFKLTEEGTQIFADYTSAHIGGYLGIVLDKRLVSAPIIQNAITGGEGQISGEFTIEQVNQLAVKLRYGSLPIPLKVIENKSVGPTLGQDSLQKSTTAGLIGLCVVMAFMAIYYRLPGMLADLALLIYATITFALFKLIPVTLTLPGIAGFVLSIGVAVDANVLIFERMKEELRSGQRLRQAIDHGFSRAWPSIRDSNLSTLITCAILYWFGNTFGASIVKGFSLTLALGVMVSLFTAITVTRTFLHLVLDNIRLIEHPRWFGV
jgi:preprotein translocase subunit SecD